jgi:putative spermidine/putrescine transport system permease protein
VAVNLTRGARAHASVGAVRPAFSTVLGAVALTVVLLGFGSTLVAIGWMSLNDPSPANYKTALDSGLFRRALTNTFKMAAAVTLISMLVGYPYAYCMAFGGRILRTFLFVALMSSFWTSVVVRSYAWQFMLNDRGLMNQFLVKDLGLIDQPLEIARTPVAVYIGMTQILVPFMVLAIYAQLRSLPADLVLAARGMGASPSQAFRSVTLPLSIPGVMAGSVLVAVLALGFYITPQLLGGARDPYIGQAIVLQVERLYRPGVGAAMAVILLVTVLVILATAGRLSRLTLLARHGAGQR